METVILLSEHKRILKRRTKRSIITHLLWGLLMAGMLIYPMVAQIENAIIQEASNTIQSELRTLQLKQQLLRSLRHRPLTLANALDIMEGATSQRTVPVPVILAILEQESQFDPKAVSPKGARGTGQLMPIVWKHFGNGTSIHDSFSNVMASIAYLTALYGGFGDWDKVLRAYAAGPDNANNRALNWYVRGVMTKVARYEVR